MNSELKTNVNVKSVFSRVGLAAAVLGVVVNLVQMLIITIFNIVNPAFESNGWFRYLLIAVSFYLIGFPLCCLILKRIPDGHKREEESLTFGGFIKFFLISYFVMVLLNLFTMGFILVVGKVKGADVVNPLEGVISNSSIWATIIFAGILSPIIEEILFRNRGASMIDPKKVRLMTKLAVYEEGPGKKDLKINCYSKRTYVNIKQLESIIAITVAYLLGLGLYCFGIYTDIISQGLKFPYQKYILHAMILYLIIIIIDFVCTRRYYTKVYDKMREDIKQYDYNLYRLARYIQKEEKDRA